MAGRPEDHPRRAVKGGGRLRAILSIAISAGLLAYLYREYFPEARDLDINWSLLAPG